MFHTFIYDIGFLTVGTIIFVVIPYQLLKLYGQRQDRLLDERDEKAMKKMREEREKKKN